MGSCVPHVSSFWSESSWKNWRQEPMLAILEQKLLSVTKVPAGLTDNVGDFAPKVRRDAADKESRDRASLTKSG